VERAIQRQELLRTTYQELDGRALQTVHEPQPVDIPLVDLSSASDPEGAAAELLAKSAREPFDLERLPQVRLVLAKLGDDDHRLIRIHHHINTDGRSWRIFMDEVSRLYSAARRGEPPPLPRETPFGFADFAVWERRVYRGDGQRFPDDVAWWRRNLAGAPPRQPLPFARKKPAPEAEPGEGLIRFGLDPVASRGLRALRGKWGATYFTVHAAAVTALLAARTDSDDLIIGTYASTRGPAETFDMFGFFANPVPLRLRFEGDPGFADWVATVRAAAIEMGNHAQSPYEEVCARLREEGAPPPELTAILSTWGTMPRVRFEGLEVSPLERHFGQMPWGFTIQIDPYWETERCYAAFDARIHDPAAVRSFIEAYRQLLRAVSSEPERPLSELLPSARPARRRRWRSRGGWSGRP
jgi:hypothetical protein